MYIAHYCLFQMETITRITQVSCTSYFVLFAGELNALPRGIRYPCDTGGSRDASRSIFVYALDYEEGTTCRTLLYSSQQKV